MFCDVLKNANVCRTMIEDNQDNQELRTKSRLHSPKAFTGS